MHSRAGKKKSFRWMKMLVLVIVAMAVVRIGGQVKTYLQLQDEAALLQEKLSVVEQEYGEKLEQIDLLNDDAYIERLARERLGMVKDGETVVMTVDPEGGVVAAAPEPGATPVE